MRITIIGCGSIGRRHIRNLIELGCEVHAMDPSQAARDLAGLIAGIASVSDVARLDVDALVISTPYDRHLEWVEEAVRRNLPFFTEKPLGSYEQIPRWRELAAMSLPVHQVGYNWRFHRGVLDLVASGRPLLLACYTNATSWPGQAYGPMVLECSHELDLAVNVLQGVRCDATLLANGARVDFDDVKCSVALEWRSDEHYRCYRAFSHNPDGLVRLPCGEVSVQIDQESIDWSYRAEMAHFVSRVRSGRNSSIACDLPGGVAVLELCQRISAMQTVA